MVLREDQGQSFPRSRGGSVHQAAVVGQWVGVEMLGQGDIEGVRVPRRPRCYEASPAPLLAVRWAGRGPGLVAGIMAR